MMVKARKVVWSDDKSFCDFSVSPGSEIIQIVWE